MTFKLFVLASLLAAAGPAFGWALVGDGGFPDGLPPAQQPPASIETDYLPSDLGGGKVVYERTASADGARFHVLAKGTVGGVSVIGEAGPAFGEGAQATREAFDALVVNARAIRRAQNQ